MIRTGYKLVRLPLYTSLFVPPPYGTVYPIGEVVRAVPNSLGLMIFDSLDNALDFMHGVSLYNVGIIEVEYNTDDIIVVDFVSSSTQLHALNEFYHDLHRGLTINPMDIILPPLGTICCSELKVIRELSKQLTKKENQKP